MPRLSTLSNPTGLVEIEKQRLSVVLEDDKARRAFSLARLDLTDLKLPPQLNVVVIASRGNTEERVDLGPVQSFDKGFRTLNEIGNDGTWGFRILLVQPGSPRLVAAAENIRPDGQGDSSAFIAIERADLGERTWEVEVKELDGRAVIRFSQDMFQSSGEAEGNLLFVSLVLPEAIRQLAVWVASRGVLADAAWEPFKSWLTMHQITDEPDQEDTDSQQAWVDRVVEAFCNRFRFVSRFSEQKPKESDA